MSYKCLVLCIALTILKEGFAGLGRDKQGPFDVVIRVVEDCQEDEVAPIKFYPKMQRVNRTTLAVKGHLDLKIPLNDKLLMTCRLDQKTPQGYKENFFSTNYQGQSACSVLGNYLDEDDIKRWSEAFKNEPTPITSCALPIGTHEFERGVTLGSFKKLPIFFYNTYRAFFQLYEELNEPPVGCLMLIVDVVPKKKRKG